MRGRKSVLSSVTNQIPDIIVWYKPVWFGTTQPPTHSPFMPPLSATLTSPATCHPTARLRLITATRTFSSFPFPLSPSVSRRAKYHITNFVFSPSDLTNFPEKFSCSSHRISVKHADKMSFTVQENRRNNEN